MQGSISSFKETLGVGSPTLLSKPRPNEPLLLYLVVSDGSIKSVPAREEGTHQLPMYYISKAFLLAKARYSDMEKLALSLITTLRKFLLVYV